MSCKCATAMRQSDGGAVWAKPPCIPGKEDTMYCILVTGIPAVGKSSAAAYLSRALALPVFS